MRALSRKLTREEALREIDSFIAELKTNWLHDHLDWALELLALLREFRNASDAKQLFTLRARLRDCLSTHELKGIDYLLSWADAVVENYEQPVV
jgi:hypothetical protein